MPPQTATSQWGYAQMWKEGRPCNGNDAESIETKKLRRSKSESRSVNLSHKGVSTNYSKSNPVIICGGTGDKTSGSVKNHGLSRSRPRSHDRVKNLCDSGAFETIGSGVAHKVPSSGGYYGVGRFTPAKHVQRMQ